MGLRVKLAVIVDHRRVRDGGVDLLRQRRLRIRSAFRNIGPRLAGLYLGGAAASHPAPAA